MLRDELDLNPVSHITVDAIGAPGKRVFYLQGWHAQDPSPVTLIIEKVQLQNLIPAIEQALEQIALTNPAPLVPADAVEMKILPPVDPRFRAGELGLGYHSGSDQVVLFARAIIMEGQELEDAPLVRFWCTRAQVQRLAEWGRKVLEAGRQLCPQCGEPMAADGHFCPKKNGHGKK